MGPIGSLVYFVFRVIRDLFVDWAVRDARATIPPTVKAGDPCPIGVAVMFENRRTFRSASKNPTWNIVLRHLDTNVGRITTPPNSNGYSNMERNASNPFYISRDFAVEFDTVGTQILGFDIMLNGRKAAERNVSTTVTP